MSVWSSIYDLPTITIIQGSIAEEVTFNFSAWILAIIRLALLGSY
jgi:hypothetical protein